MTKLLCILLLACPLFGQTTHTTASQEGNNAFTGNNTHTGTETFSSASISGAFSVGLRERDCRQDGTIDVTGVIDASTVVQNCINNAYTNNQTAVLPGTPPTGSILIQTGQNWTNKPGLRVRGTSNTLANGVGSDFGTTIVCSIGTPGGNPSSVCIDTTGTSNLELSHLQIKTFFTGIALLMGRDNAGSPSGSGQFCFQNNYKIHDISINMSANLTANGNFGNIGIVNLAAEDGIFENVDILADTPAYSSALNPIPITSPYQTTLTGCTNATMTQVTFNNFQAQATNLTKQAFYANNTGRFWFTGGRFAGGLNTFRIENTGGAVATYDWHMRTAEEQTGTGAIFSTSAGLDNFDVLITDVSQGITALFNPTVNNLVFSNMRVNMNEAAIPFITNTTTGTTWKGGQILIPAATSASNTTLNGTLVNSPTVADASIAFNAASNYTIFDSTGTMKVHTGAGTSSFPSTTGTLGQTSGTHQYQFTCTGTATANTTLTINNAGVTTCTTTGSNPTSLAAATGTISNLRVLCGTGGVNASSGVFSVVANLSTSAVTCTMGTGNTCSDTTHTVAVTAGQQLQLKFTTQIGETLANCTGSFTQQ